MHVLLSTRMRFLFFPILISSAFFGVEINAQDRDTLYGCRNKKEGDACTYIVVVGSGYQEKDGICKKCPDSSLQCANSLIESTVCTNEIQEAQPAGDGSVILPDSGPVTAST
jgi:hypothetical protein